MHQLLTGKDERPIKYDITGPSQIQSGTLVGKRPVMLTNTAGLMNLLGREGWKEGATSRQRKMAPVASNAYETILHEQIERLSSKLMSDEVFLSKPQEVQNAEWNSIMEDMRELARNDLAANYRGAGQTIALQFEITRVSSASDIRNSISEIGLDGDLGELSLVQMRKLKAHMDSQKLVTDTEIQRGVSRIKTNRY